MIDEVLLLVRLRLSVTVSVRGQTTAAVLLLVSIDALGLGPAVMGGAGVTPVNVSTGAPVQASDQLYVHGPELHWDAAPVTGTVTTVVDTLMV